MKFYQFILVLLASYFVAPSAFSQKQLKFDVKIKLGFAVESLGNDEVTAIGSGKDILLVSNTSGLVVKRLQGLGGNINDLHSDISSELLAVATASGKCYIWDVRKGSIKYTLAGHSKSLLGVRFVNRSQLVTLGADNQVILWDMASGNKVTSFKDHVKPIKAMGAANDIIITGDKSGFVAIRSKTQDSLLFSVSLNSAVTSIAVNKNGRRGFLGTADGEIIILDITNQVIDSRFNNGRGSINKLVMAADNNHLAVCARDMKVYVSESMNLVKEYDLVASAVIAASFTPDGDNLFFIEEFAPRASCLDVGDLDIARAMNFKDDKDKTPPQIYLSSPAKIIDNRVVSYENLLVLRGSVIDDYGVQELKINGIITPVKENGNFVINVPLSMGENFINIEITDINQNTALKKFIVTRKNMDGTAYDPGDATNYLLVVGINKYEHWPQLYNAVRDANDVVSALLGLYDFEFANVTLITDDQASRSNLYNTLRGFVNKVGPKDNFMIYYSGHGYFDEVLNEGYWVPSDARVNQTGDYLSNSDISKIIANIDSQHTFLVADACFSGSLFNESSRGYAENVEKFRSRWGLASGRLETVSDGAVGANSPFAQSFIHYLKTNDKSKVAVSQLVQYVKVEVAETSDQTPIGNPLKGVGDEGGEFVLYKKE